MPGALHQDLAAVTAAAFEDWRHRLDLQ